MQPSEQWDKNTVLISQDGSWELQIASLLLFPLIAFWW